MKINNWKEFDFSEVFDFKRGKRLVKLDQASGNIAYISSTKENNGIDNYIQPPEYMTIYSNALTINNSGSVGYCFYHYYNFVCSDHCTVILIKDKKIKLNVYLALFLKPIIETMKTKYNFAREISDCRLSKEKIVLPFDKNGKPDWVFMEKEIKKYSDKILFDKKTPYINYERNNNAINQSSWSEFKIKNLFKIDKGERLVKLERQSGTTPLLTASSINNGISEYIDYDTFLNSKKIFENKITVDMFCNVFYHDYRYFSDDNIHTLSFLNKDFDVFYENKYVNLFLVTILKELTNKFDYGRQVRLKRFEEEIISLPSKKHNNIEIPDFEFMEMYMKSLPYSSSII